jgi:hypothetical protein
MFRRTLILTLMALLLGAATAAFSAEKKGGSKTGIEWKVSPAHVVIWLDGKKIGDAGSLTFTDTKPGKHAVKLTKGGDETEMEVKVNKGEVVKFEFEFTDG